MTENPYRLARDIRGIGFKTADAIAMKLGVEKTALIRVRAGISYALTEAMDEGHCGLPTEELIPLAEKLLEVPHELIRTALDLELQEGTVVADRVLVDIEPLSEVVLTNANPTGGGGMPEIKTEKVLRDEAVQIHPDIPIEANAKLPDLYRCLNRLNSAALCLSGGGIRSAAFALGVIQALATHPKTARSPGTEAQYTVDCAQNSLLSKFHYLSTVSGGGYIGSWLSAWRLATPFADIWANLVGRPGDPDKEAAPLEWLRTYSNYITPKVGIGSLDTWTVATLWLRNLLLNWLVILPAICAAVLVVKFTGLLSTWVILWDNPAPGPLIFHQENPLWKELIEGGFGIAAVACVLWTTILVGRNRPVSRSIKDRGLNDSQFLIGPLLWSLLSAIALVHVLASDLAGNLLLHCDRPSAFSLCTRHPFERIGASPQARGAIADYLWVGASCGLAIYTIGGLLSANKRPDFALVKWAASGAVYGALVGVGFHTYLEIPDSGVGDLPVYFIHFVFGVPWILLSQIIADMVFVGLSSHEACSEEDREWSARAYGWLAALAGLWLITMFLVFFGAIVAPIVGSDSAEKLKTVIPTIAGVSGVITAVFGKWIGSARQDAGGLLAYARRAVFPLAAIVFATALVIVVSHALDILLFGDSLISTHAKAPELENLFSALIPGDWLPTTYRKILDEFLVGLSIPIANVLGLTTFSWSNRFAALLGALSISVLVGVVTSKSININRFSLHSLYRNRLVRAFLGAARTRSPDRFDGFDAADNPPMHKLWDPSDRKGRPFHIINVAVNVVLASRLAWQERKAEPFTISPLHCGSSFLGYRSSLEYGGETGITLGTALAISGAAVSPSMGYHSSPGVAFLLSILNVRLGWWLGNPGPKGEATYRTDGPDFAIRSFIYEALGRTTDGRKYVYLSDGGHFENLGLYEMIRRRCRFIVVSDATCDPDCSFLDLGNTLRKISIDLGVRITFEGLDKLKKRGAEGADRDAGRQYHAVGEIDYRAADGEGENGLVLYIKAGYRGTESVAIRAYATEYSDFPHQSTADQWFTESQFESYRALGFEITDSVLAIALADKECAKNPSLENILATLRRETKSSPSVHGGQQR